MVKPTVMGGVPNILIELLFQKRIAYAGVYRSCPVQSREKKNIQSKPKSFPNHATQSQKNKEKMNSITKINDNILISYVRTFMVNASSLVSQWFTHTHTYSDKCERCQTPYRIWPYMIWCKKKKLIIQWDNIFFSIYKLTSCVGDCVKGKIHATGQSNRSESLRIYLLGVCVCDLDTMNVKTSFWSATEQTQPKIHWKEHHSMVFLWQDYVRG